MTKLQRFLERACHDLGLVIVQPYDVRTQSGIRLQAQALLPQLGGPKGMIVVGHFDELGGAAAELVEMGFGFSVIGEPLPAEEFHLASFIEMFSDWGWGGAKETRPQWMLEP